MDQYAPLRDFITNYTELVPRALPESETIAQGRALLAQLIATPDWLHPDLAAPGPAYRQNLLHCDPLQRFSMVCFVWGPGQQTPVHDHTVYGLIGLLRGREIEQRYDRAPDGTLTPTFRSVLTEGQTAFVSPSTCDLHRVANGLDSEASISIHVYGGNIGAISRASYDEATGAARSFISGYSNAWLPNIWNRG